MRDTGTGDVSDGRPQECLLCQTMTQPGVCRVSPDHTPDPAQCAVIPTLTLYQTISLLTMTLILSQDPATPEPSAEQHFQHNPDLDLVVQAPLLQGDDG